MSAECPSQTWHAHRLRSDRRGPAAAISSEVLSFTGTGDSQYVRSTVQCQDPGCAHLSSCLAFAVCKLALTASAGSISEGGLSSGDQTCWLPEHGQDVTSYRYSHVADVNVPACTHFKTQAEHAVWHWAAAHVLCHHCISQHLLLCSNALGLYLTDSLEGL